MTDMAETKLRLSFQRGLARQLYKNKSGKVGKLPRALVFQIRFSSLELFHL